MLSQTGSGDTRFKFTGHEHDDESALDYMLARMYESGTGRFLQMDPLADKYPGISPYVYTAGNPLKYVDPDGRIIRLGGINKGLMAKSDIVDFIGKDNSDLLTYTSSKDAGGNPILILGINQGALDAGGQFDFSRDGVQDFIEMVANETSVYQYNVDIYVEYAANSSPYEITTAGGSGGERDRIARVDPNGYIRPSAQPKDPRVDAVRTIRPDARITNAKTKTPEKRWKAVRHEFREMKHMVEKGTSLKAAQSGNAKQPFYTREHAHIDAGDRDVRLDK